MIELAETELIERGRNDVMRIAGIMVGVEIGVILSNLLQVGAGNLPQQLVRLAVTIVLLALLFRGFAWVRWLLLVLAGLGLIAAGGSVQALFADGRTAEGIVMAIIGIGYLIVARTLLWSPGIGPYLAARRAAGSSGS